MWPTKIKNKKEEKKKKREMKKKRGNEGINAQEIGFNVGEISE